MAKGYSFVDLAQPLSCVATPSTGGSLVAGTTYYYRIIGVYSGGSYQSYWYGKSKCSAEFSGTADAVNKSMTISFNCPLASNTSYRIFRSTVSNGQILNKTSMIEFYPEDATYNTGGGVTFVDTGYNLKSGNYFLEIDNDPHGRFAISGSTSSDKFSIVDLYDADQANGWGVIEKLDVNTYKVNCYLSGHSYMYWEDKEKTILFTDGTSLPYNGDFTFGEISGDNRTKKGCNIIVSSPWLSSLSFGTLHAYRTIFQYIFPYYNTDLGLTGAFFSAGVVQDCQVDRFRNFVPNGYGAKTLKNFIMSKFDNAFSRYAANYDNVRMLGGSRVWQISGGVTHLTAKGVYTEGTLAVLLVVAGGSSLTLIDSITTGSMSANVDSEGFLFYDKISFNLNVTDEDGVFINNAIVKVYDKDDVLVTDTTTDTNGDIVEQIITRVKYIKNAGTGISKTTYLKYPFKIVVSKTNFLTYQEVVSYASSLPIVKTIALAEINLDATKIYDSTLYDCVLY